MPDCKSISAFFRTQKKEKNVEFFAKRALKVFEPQKQLVLPPRSAVFEHKSPSKKRIVHCGCILWSGFLYLLDEWLK
jgi:hypothetical protein